jgi:hypothetical protein
LGWGIEIALEVVPREFRTWPAPAAGAALTLKLAGFGSSGQVLAARIGPKMTLSQSSLENLYRLTLLRRADVAVDLHRRLARRVTQQLLGDARMDACPDQ